MGIGVGVVFAPDRVGSVGVGLLRRLELAIDSECARLRRASGSVIGVRVRRGGLGSLWRNGRTGFGSGSWSIRIRGSMRR